MEAVLKFNMAALCSTFNTGKMVFMFLGSYLASLDSWYLLIIFRPREIITPWTKWDLAVLAVLKKTNLLRRSHSTQLSTQIAQQAIIFTDTKLLHFAPSKLLENKLVRVFIKRINRVEDKHISK